MDITSNKTLHKDVKEMLPDGVADQLRRAADIAVHGIQFAILKEWEEDERTFHPDFHPERAAYRMACFIFADEMSDHGITVAADPLTLTVVSD